MLSSLSACGPWSGHKGIVSSPSVHLGNQAQQEVTQVHALEDSWKGEPLALASSLFLVCGFGEQLGGAGTQSLSEGGVPLRAPEHRWVGGQGTGACGLAPVFSPLSCGEVGPLEYLGRVMVRVVDGSGKEAGLG